MGFIKKYQSKIIQINEKRSENSFQELPDLINQPKPNFTNKN
jgi:hypothetical protein